MPLLNKQIYESGLFSGVYLIVLNNHVDLKFFLRLVKLEIHLSEV